MKAFSLCLVLATIAWGCSRNGNTRADDDPAPEIPQPEPQLEGSRSNIVTAQFAPDGRRIIVASKDGTVRVWDAQTGRALSTSNGSPVRVWDLSQTESPLPRYQPETPDNMPIVGPDQFQVLQDQIDALQKRVEELEGKVRALTR